MQLITYFIEKKTQYNVVEFAIAYSGRYRVTRYIEGSSFACYRISSFVS